MKRAVLLLFLSSCSLQWHNITKLDVVAQQRYCERLDVKQMAWGISSLALSGVSGVTGLAGSVVDDRSGSLALGSGALFFAVGSAVAAYLSSYYVQLFCRQCANLVPVAQ